MLTILRKFWGADETKGTVCELWDEIEKILK